MEMSRYAKYPHIQPASSENPEEAIAPLRLLCRALLLVEGDALESGCPHPEHTHTARAEERNSTAQQVTRKGIL